MPNQTEAIRPTRSLLAHLPRLPVTPQHGVDFAAADPDLLLLIAGDAEILVSAMHLGIGAIGQLLAESSVVVEDGTIGADGLEALGYLIAELGDLAAGCMTLAAHCRRATADYLPSAGRR